MTAKDEGRNDAKTLRIVEACLRARSDPRVALSPILTAEGVHADNIARLSRAPINPDGIARLLNYHFAFQTFAVVRKGGQTILARLADGCEFTPGNVIKEFTE